MMNLNLQFFAHKKGMGSTKNGRDSNATSLSKPATSFTDSAAHTSIPALT